MSLTKQWAAGSIPAVIETTWIMLRSCIIAFYTLDRLSGVLKQINVVLPRFLLSKCKTTVIFKYLYYKKEGKLTYVTVKLQMRYRLWAPVF